ncbi:MAG TPA: hemolysin III family protein [Gaiellaceae bacterium]|nr:hemolysin III family protein [Gaiellaceae bacterium]
MRGVLHLWAFPAAVVAAVPFVWSAPEGVPTVAAAVFATCVAAMLGTSALYHRVFWPTRARRLMRRADHAAIFLLIAGTYTPVGLLVLEGAWRWSVLSIVWAGAAVAIVLKLAWVDAPPWVAAGIGLAIGWTGIAAFPKILGEIGLAGTLLLAAGGAFYTVGAVIYARKRPDPVPHVFGYHELFHALTIGAALCQYAAIAFFVVRA